MGTANVEGCLHRASYTHTHAFLYTRTQIEPLLHTHTHLFGYAGLNGYKHIYTSDSHCRKDSTMLRSFLPVRRWCAACLTALRQTVRQTEGEKTVCVCVKAAARDQLPLNQQQTDQTHADTHRLVSVHKSAVKYQGEARSDTHTHTRTF